MVKKFPKMLYVTREGNGDNKFLVALENIESHATVGVKERVGVYQLIETREVEGVVESRTV